MIIGAHSILYSVPEADGSAEPGEKARKAKSARATGGRPKMTTAR